MYLSEYNPFSRDYDVLYSIFRINNICKMIDNILGGYKYGTIL